MKIAVYMYIVFTIIRWKRAQIKKGKSNPQSVAKLLTFELKTCRGYDTDCY